MRVLLAVHSCYTDNLAGGMRCLRTMMQWLGEAGHAVQVLSTVRMDVEVRTDGERTLRELTSPYRRLPAPEGFRRHLRRRGMASGGLDLVAYTLDGVPVEMLLTEHNNAEAPDRLEYEQFIYHLDQALVGFQPDIVLSYGRHPVVPAALKRAHERGVTTVLTVRSPGFEDPVWYVDADYVFTPSRWLSERLRTAAGIDSVDLPQPLSERDILAPEESRAFVTFVNPGLHKGVQLFARLADMLGRSRPDIPILVVQSAAGAGELNSIPGIDFARYPQIVASPPVPQPKDFLALTRLLLVPSTFDEISGRVAAEAMLNGIPPLVSDRGGLPETVAGAGIVLPLPAWLAEDSTRLPSKVETQPWFDAVCRLWDDAGLYGQAAARCRETAQRLYGEAVLRQRYEEYFTALPAGGRGATPPAGARSPAPP